MDEEFLPRNDLLSREELRNKFGILNYVIFVAMLMMSALIGIFYWWKGKQFPFEFIEICQSFNL